MRSNCVEDMNNPFFRNEFNIMPDEALPLYMLDTPEYDEVCKTTFLAKQATKLKLRVEFTFQDALEDNLDVWTLGRNIYDMPLANTYIPVKNTIMPKPNLQDSIDELGYRWGNVDGDRVLDKGSRIDYTSQLNPLKGYRTGSGPRPIQHRDYLKPYKTLWSKDRRLSKTKNLRRFSTTIERPSEDVAGKAGMYAKFSSMLPGNIISSMMWQNYLKK